MRSAVRLKQLANSPCAVVGTVSSTDTTVGTSTVNVTRSTPNGLFSGTDTFDVGSQTIVLGNQVAMNFPQSSSSPTSSATATNESTRQADRRALKLLRHEQAKHGHHTKK
jgi:hypothetical protein